MTPPTGETTRLLEGLAAGGADALNWLISHTQERLRRLTRRMLRGFPGVGRQDKTDDVCQEVWVRLLKPLRRAAPRSSRHLMNLAARKIRYCLIDRARKYAGPHGLGANHHTDGSGKAADDPGQPLARQADAGGEPGSLDAWTRFHEWVKNAPPPLREAFNLLWYQGLPIEAAAKLARVSPRTMKRRWQDARIALARALGEMPE
jgi:RNA polymerase sigma-70 factor (ECF subfamily)